MRTELYDQRARRATGGTASMSHTQTRLRHISSPSSPHPLNLIFLLPPPQ